MKRFCVIVLSILLLVSVTACSYSNLDAERLRIDRYNKNSVDVATKYHDNVGTVEEFNNIVKGYLQGEIPSSGVNFDKYSNCTRVFKDTLDTLLSNITAELVKKNMTPETYRVYVETYPLLVEDSGDIKDFILVKCSDIQYKIYMTWVEGKYTTYYWE